MRRLCFLLLILSAGFCAAQEGGVSLPKRSYVGFSPIHLAIRQGLKLEVGTTANTRNYFFASPEFYAGKLRNTDSGRVWGLGLQLGNKRILNASPGGNLFFVSLAAQYNFFQLTGEGYRWEEYVVDDLTYYQYKLGPVKRNIQRFGFDFSVGYMKMSETGFYFELAMGASYRVSRLTATANYDVRNYRDAIPWDFGYTGLVPLIHSRVGFAFD